MKRTRFITTLKGLRREDILKSSRPHVVTSVDGDFELSARRPIDCFWRLALRHRNIRSRRGSHGGGGKFTTNPGKIWIEHLRDKTGFELTPNRHDGFKQPVAKLGGYNYAQGGARVTDPEGNGVDKGYSARPLREQFQYFVDEHEMFQPRDFIFIQGGANDIFVLMSQIAKKEKTPAEAIRAMSEAATDLADLAKKAISLGATSRNIVVLNLPQVEKTPSVLLIDAKAQMLVAQMGQTFNARLAQELSTTGVQLVDVYTFDSDFNQNFAQYGLTNITDPACLTASLPIKSSLACNADDLTEPSANEKYKFADMIHPATGYSRIVAEFILGSIKVPEKNQ